MMSYIPSGIKHAFREVLRDTTVDPGNTAVLKCNPPESHPAPIITWLKDKSQITDDGSRVFITPSGNLYILNVDYADEGLYQCVALNPITNASRESNEAMLIVSGEQGNPYQMTLWLLTGGVWFNLFQDQAVGLGWVENGQFVLQNLCWNVL